MYIVLFLIHTIFHIHSLFHCVIGGGGGGRVFLKSEFSTVKQSCSTRGHPYISTYAAFVFAIFDPPAPTSCTQFLQCTC